MQWPQTNPIANVTADIRIDKQTTDISAALSMAAVVGSGISACQYVGMHLVKRVKVCDYLAKLKDTNEINSIYHNSHQLVLPVSSLII